MKPLIVFFLLSIFSLGAFAQQDFSLKFSPKIDFQSGKLAPDSTFLSFKNALANPDFQKFYTLPKKATPYAKALLYRNKMPIAKPHGSLWNMPIAVPDSTVNFAIREKRIELMEK